MGRLAGIAVVVMAQPKNGTGAGVRCFLVEDVPIVRRGLAILLSQEPGMTICGESDTASEALARIVALHPDVALVDLRLREGDGLEVIKQLRAQGLNLKILVYSTHDERAFVQAAFQAGADGYVTKEEGTDRLLEAIHVVLAGGSFISESLSRRTGISPPPMSRAPHALN